MTAPFISDTLNDVGAHATFLEAHVVAAGGPWVPSASLPQAAASKVYFTTAGNGNRLRPVDNAVNGYIYLATTPAPGDGQCDVVSALFNASTPMAAGDRIGWAIGTATSVPQFVIGYSRGAQAWRLWSVGTGSLTQIGASSATYTAWTPGTAITPTLSLRKNGANPRYIVTVGGVTVFDITDTTTAWSSLGLYPGLFIEASGQGTLSDTTGPQFTGAFTVTEYQAITSDTPAVTETLQQAIVLTGTNLGWLTAGSPLEIVEPETNMSGSSIVSQVVNQAAQTVTVTLLPGGLTSAPTPGTIRLRDKVNTTAYVDITVNPAGLVLAGITRLIAGLETDALTLSLTPPGSTPAASTEATITAKIAGALAGTFPGSTDGTGQVRVVIGPHTTAVRIPYTAPVNATPGSTVVFTVTASNFTTSTLSAPVLARATAIALSGPSGGAQDEDSAPFTVALFPVGSGTPDGGVPFLMTDQDAGGFYDPPGGVLTTDSPSVPVVYHAPHGAATRLIGLTNSGGLVNPTPRSYTVTALGDYTISGPTDGPKDTASDVFTFTLTNATVTGDVHLPLDDGRQSGQQGTWHLLDGTLVTQLTLNYQTARSVGVRYTPPFGYVSADAAGSLQLSATNDRGLQNAPATPYQAWDPAVSGRVAVGADFGAGFSGQAATLGFVAWDLSTKQMVLDHPAGIISEVPGLGVYGAPAVLPLSFTGVIVWDDPDGYTGERFVQWIDMQAPVTPVLSPTDRANNRTDMQTAFTAAGMIGPDITSMADAMASQQGMARFLFYLATNSTQDPAGNVIVRNASGQIIVNAAGHTINTLLQTYLSGVLTVVPGTQ